MSKCLFADTFTHSLTVDNEIKTNIFLEIHQMNIEITFCSGNSSSLEDSPSESASFWIMDEVRHPEEFLSRRGRESFDNIDVVTGIDPSDKINFTCEISPRSNGCTLFILNVICLYIRFCSDMNPIESDFIPLAGMTTGLDRSLSAFVAFEGDLSSVRDKPFAFPSRDFSPIGRVVCSLSNWRASLSFLTRLFNRRFSSRSTTNISIKDRYEAAEVYTEGYQWALVIT